jgi:hypothetical protein
VALEVGGSIPLGHPKIFVGLPPKGVESRAAIGEDWSDRNAILTAP